MEYSLQLRNRNSSDEDIIQDIIRVSTVLGKSKLTRDEYRLHGKYGSTTVSRHFGTWNEALMRAGLEVTHIGISKHKRCSSVDDFFCDLREIATKLNSKTVTFGEYRKYGTYDCSQMLRYYHSWDTILKNAGLTPTKYRIGAGKQICDIELLQEIQRVWNLLNRQPKVSDFHDGIFRFSLNTYS